MAATTRRQAEGCWRLCESIKKASVTPVTKRNTAGVRPPKNWLRTYGLSERKSLWAKDWNTWPWSMMQAANPRVQSRNARRLPLVEDPAITVIHFSFHCPGASAGPECQNRLFQRAAAGGFACTWLALVNSVALHWPFRASSELLLNFAAAGTFACTSL